MRRRWRWEFDPLVPAVMAVAWGVLGFVAILTVGVAFRNHDRRGNDTGAAWVHSPIHWILPVWAAPIVLTLVIVGALRVPAAVRWSWEHRPRRVWESVEDLREHYRR